MLESDVGQPRPLKRPKSYSKLFKVPMGTIQQNFDSECMACETNQSSIHLKKAKTEDVDMLEVNSDVGQVSAEDFETMRDVMTRVSDEREVPEGRTSDLGSPLPMAPGQPFGTIDLSKLVAFDYTSPAQCSPVNLSPSSIAQNMKKSLKAKCKKHVKSRSVYYLKE